MKKQATLERDAASDAIDMLLSALRMNGQVCGREMLTADTPDCYISSILLPEATALQETHNNRYVNDALKKIQDAGLSAPECFATEDMDSRGVCVCETPQSLFLYATYVSLDSPLRCGDCGLSRPLYRVPPTKEEEYNDIICWQSDYQCCDRLQMNCRNLERAAMRQLSRLDSSLSRDGLAICRRICELTGIPTYHYLYRYGGRSLRKERQRLCPACQSEWLLAEPWHDFDFKCDKCRLISNIAHNVI